MKQITKFPLELEIKLFTQLKKLFKAYAVEDQLTEQQLSDAEQVTVMTQCNVLMCIAKTQETRQVLRPFICKDDKINKEPTLDYSVGKMGTGAKISMDYLKRVIDILDVFNKLNYKNTYSQVNAKIQTLHDYPLTIENEYFRFIIAPRVEND
jgi:hypothetical protein